MFFGHHVAPDEAAHALRASDLHDRLRYLQRTRDLVSLVEAVRWLDEPGARPRRPARLAVVTFDDGYRDNLVHLLPVLRAADAPATVFVATAPILEGGPLWFDQARAALQAATEAEVARVLAKLTADSAPSFGQAGAPPNGEARRALMEHLKRSGPDRRQELLAELPVADVSAEQAMMTAEELRELAGDSHVTIGAHTHTHQILSCCDAVTGAQEMRRNMASLQQATGLPPTLFAYPNGRLGDFNAETADILKAAGMIAAVTTVPGLNSPGTPLLELKRLPLGEGAVARFAWQVDLRGP